MTIEELMEKLSMYPKDAEVVFDSGDGEDYCEIDEVGTQSSDGIVYRVRLK